MSIGIYDADLAKYTLVCFNLEAMKISAYYKKRREIVILSPQFSPEKNVKFFYRKDYDDGLFPPNLNAPNVEYGGLAFSNNVYAPLPLEIEKMRPDTSLYSKMEHHIKFLDGFLNDERKKIFDNLTAGEHCRLSLDGKTVWPEYWRQFKYLPVAHNVFFHDYDLGKIEGSFDAVQQIVARGRQDSMGTKVGMKFPVQINDGDSLQKWSSLNPNSTFFSLQYNGIIDRPTFRDWIGHVKQRAIYRIDYMCTNGALTEDQFIRDGLPQLLRQALVSRSYGQSLLLKYDEDFFSDKRWCRVMDLIAMFAKDSSTIPITEKILIADSNTLRKYVLWCQRFDKNSPGIAKGLTVSAKDMRDIFRFVRAQYPDLYEEFNTLTIQDLGDWYD